MKTLTYPFDSEYILKKKKSIKNQLMDETTFDVAHRIPVKIAILGGSTTHDIRAVLELFLLNYGLQPTFYESEYNMYWQDVMFDAPELVEFAPDVAFIHTSFRNLKTLPTVRDSHEEVDGLLVQTYKHYEAMWQKLENTYHCSIIQNNFEQPFYRLLGNKDVADFHGATNFVHNLNTKFYEYAQKHNNFYINDINYMASCYGLQKWSDPFYWHMYKYALAVPAIPEFAYNLANIIKSLYGKNKKGLVLDLDNTLWGGVVGDDGADNIEIGQETSMAQLYSEFQQYLKAHKDLGIVLSVNSKNEEENALAGLRRPDSNLQPEDFVVIKANWEPKDRNLVEIAKELNLGADSMVFVDDNPAEQHIVREMVPGVAVPEIGTAEQYLQRIDRSGFFEVTNLSEDDLKRNEMYQENAKRSKLEASFADYSEYLLSLEMKAEIKTFSPLYMSRIAQLTNKSNQFNLTTKRCTQTELEDFAANPDYITLYGKLEDKFGDNGVVSVVFGHIDGAVKTSFHIDLWLMSCRVLKRDMEFAMMDALIAECQKRGIMQVYGYYYPTAKNKMVKDFYALQGFTKLYEDVDGNVIWQLKLSEGYDLKNKVITVNS